MWKTIGLNPNLNQGLNTLNQLILFIKPINHIEVLNQNIGI